MAGMQVGESGKSLASFDAAFESLTGFGPFPWQRRLFESLTGGKGYDALDIPTGLGKTSVIPIWLLAHLLGGAGSRPPMRLVYVVNRRTIVDQASEIAARLWRNAAGEATVVQQLWREQFGVGNADDEGDRLAVSTLRGALADNRLWMRHPHRPAIIVGTVDMIGSRLLFGAYRAGRWSKAIHAGLLGQDALLVHDEAHLTEPFQKMVEWIAAQQADPKKSTQAFRPLRVLAMSATGGPAENVLRLGENDLRIEVVRERVHSRKRLKLHKWGGKGKVAEELARLAARHEGKDGAARRVIIFVREPASASVIVEILRTKYKVDGERIALLTGTLRGHERDKLVETPVLKAFLGTSEQPAESQYLVSTSAGEVGADFDADELVCDLSPLDSMIQRLGRVNRKGGKERVSEVDVVLDIQGEKLSEFQMAAVRAAAWLAGLPVVKGADGWLDGSPAALRERRVQDAHAYQEACAPRPVVVTPHPAMLDAWSLTSIQEDWAVAPELDDYLHGLKDYEPARTSLAWRAELSKFFPYTAERPELAGPQREERREAFEEWMELCRLHPREVVTDNSEGVMELLETLAERHPHAPLAQVEWKKIRVDTLAGFVAPYREITDKKLRKRFCEGLRDQTLILPTEVGGLSQGFLDQRAEAAVPDVGDLAQRDRDGAVQEEGGTRPRLRLWLKANEDNELNPEVLGSGEGVPAPTEPPADPTKSGPWVQSVRAAFAKHKFKPVWQRTFDDDDGEKRSGVLVLLKPQLIKKDAEERVLLSQHGEDAGKFAKIFGEALELPADCAEAIRWAAQWHDRGKNCERWQRCIKNPDPQAPLAKSFGKGMNVDALGGYRHEFGSLIDVVGSGKKYGAEGVNSLRPEVLDLVLHLIAAHHGRGRPFFPEGTAFDPDAPEQAEFGELLSAGEMARRFARLQRRYGHWGLAYLESLVMCADHAASRGEDPEDVA
jgi:CRISPR-associated endonuclease/helicase Cas3